MQQETNDVKELFDKAVQVKEERGKNYDNQGLSAYERSLMMYGDDSVVVSSWPVVQKASRLISLSQELKQAEKVGNVDDKTLGSLTDTCIDLVNYVGMYWVKNVKPRLPKETVGSITMPDEISDADKKVGTLTVDEK